MWAAPIGCLYLMKVTASKKSISCTHLCQHVLKLNICWYVLKNSIMLWSPIWNLTWIVWRIYLYINLACLGVCLFVCLYPINVKTAEQIGPKFFVGHLGTPGKVYESSKFQIFLSIKIRSWLNFWKFWKSTKFFVKIREIFLFCFTMYTRRTCSQLI